MGRPNYAADGRKYGAFDAKVQAANKDPKKLHDAIKFHPDFKKAALKKTNSVKAKEFLNDNSHINTF